MTDCGITCGACPLAGLCGDPVPPARPLSADVARHAADVTALAEARWAALVDPDAPDVDPAEPKPEGAGCCGGNCLLR